MAKFNFFTGRCAQDICQDRQFVMEQHRVVRNILPGVYGLIYFSTLVMTFLYDTGSPALISTYLPLVLIAASFPRFLHWVYNRQKFAAFTPDLARKDLANVLMITPLIAVGFSAIGALSYFFHQNTAAAGAMFFIWAIGLVVAVALTILPVLAISIVAILTVPLVSILLIGGDTTDRALAFIYTAVATFAIFMIIGLFKGFKDLALSKTSLSEKNQQLDTARRIAETAATTDGLTGLFNRRHFAERVAIALNEPNSSNQDERQVLVGLIGVGGMKRVFGLIGHNGRDRVVCEIADRLKSSLGAKVVLARQRSDEFAFMIENFDNKTTVAELGRTIDSVVSLPMEVNGANIMLTAALGFALSSSDEQPKGKDHIDLVERADFALREAWQKHGLKLAVFEQTIQQKYQRHAALEQALGLAITNDQIILHYQPIHDLKTGKMVACEALARWQNKDLGVVRPDEIIRIAEKSGEISRLTLALLHKAASTAAHWPRQVTLSFNLSASLFADRTIGLKILSILAKTGLSPFRLELEITETAAVNDSREAEKIIRALRRAGVKIALDDFGTGFASLSQLTAWPLDKVKLDKSLIDGVTEDEQKLNMLLGVFEMVSALNISCLMEGVETSEQVELLKKLPCDFVQGYYFAKPMENPFAARQEGTVITRRRKIS